MIPLAVGAGDDPLALIISAGAAIISALASLVLLFLLSRFKRIEEDIKGVAGHLIGNDGMTVKMTDLGGRVRTLEAEVNALKSATLNREIFERATKEQNDKLDDLKLRTREMDHKIEKIDSRLPRPTYDSPIPRPYNK